MALRKGKGPLLAITKVGEVEGSGVLPPRWEGRLGTTTTRQKDPTDTTNDAITSTTWGSALKEDQTNELTKIVTTIGNPSGVTMVDTHLEEETGAIITDTESIVSSNTSSAVDASGNFIVAKQLNKNWWLQTASKTVSSVLTSGRSWTVAEHVTLPRVLMAFTPLSVDYKSFYDPHGNVPDHNNPDYINPGGGIAQAGFYFELKDFSGVRTITVTERWYSTAQSVSGTLLSPQSFSWWTPYNVGSVPECLHGAISFSGTTGTDHPTLKYYSWNYTFAATSPSTLSGVIALSAEQTPHKGGYLVRTRTIAI